MTLDQKRNYPKRCPFKIGQIVIYRPSKHGYNQCAMMERLEIGKSYKIIAIIEGLYVEVEGYAYPGDGLYWTEFSEE
ncbi:MAG: hypothetical protein LW857_06095 [Verrucomicrobiae bacterium]|jgi:hypothetical protein|nr:hypothetical protein [Verrucomicrobiae bacterium]